MAEHYAVDKIKFEPAKISIMENKIMYFIVNDGGQKFYDRELQIFLSFLKVPNG